MTITTELERLLVRVSKQSPAVVVAIEEQKPVSDEVERLRLVVEESQAAAVVYHLTAQ